MLNELTDHPYRLRTGVYCILNIVNGKRYIGSAAQSFWVRLRRHRSRLSCNTHCNKHLQAAWNKYGEVAFKIVLLKVCNVEDCIRSEQYFINRFKSSDSRYGYNQCSIAGSTLGIKLSIEARENISRGSLGKQKGPMSEETKRKLSEAKKGKKHSLETRLKISAVGVRPCSPETRAKIGDAQRGKRRKPHTEETKLKMRLAASRRKGMRNARSKLTTEQVKFIREQYSKGGVTQQFLAKEFGVDQGAISSVISRKSYKDVA